MQLFPAICASALEQSIDFSLCGLPYRPLNHRGQIRGDRKESSANLGKKLNFSHDAFAPVKFAVPAGCSAQRIAPHAHGIGGFECLNRCIERIRHVRVNAAQPVGCWPRPHSARDGFVVGERLPCAWIDAHQ